MGAYFTISSIGYILILIITFFSKKGYKNIETKIYQLMLILTLIGLSLDAFGYVLYMLDFSVNSFLYTTISKLVLLYFAAWELSFTYYTYIISSTKILSNNLIRKQKTILCAIFLIISYIVFSFPVSFKTENSIIYLQGLGVSFSYVIVAVCYILCLFMAFKNIKNIINRKYIPLLAMLVFSIFIPIIQCINPGLYLTNYFISIIMTIFYFTIENPDMKMLEEFHKSKDYAEASNEEKSIFLYDITQNLRRPLNEINGACNQLSTMTNNKELNKGFDYIYSRSNNLLGTINSVLDITNMDICNIKVFDTKYNTRLLFSEIIKMVEKEIPDNVKFISKIDKSITEQLYGDPIRLKQVIKALLENATKYTKEGYIELSAHEIIKNDISRLIITVEDTGEGIKTDELKQIFDKENQEFNDMDKIDDNEKNLITTKKIITLLGGTLIYNSELSKGSKFTIVLDQKIAIDKSKELKKIESLTERYIDLPKVIVVSENEEYLTKTIKKLSKYNLDVVETNLGAKCIEKVRHNTKYNYILLDEDLKTLDVFQVFKKLKEISSFKGKIYVLSKDEKTLKYKKNGFDKTISKKLKSTEIEDLI